ncbi:hypothetical protein MROS_0783 [Melioribacter roseus P3M-2]|uniref:DUF2231 domain-containing protein n=1 Tax=Melioribacter roseus (strain DSM 23840 / JCM 17771 / VKM B-2668 / P3M-2) TaxID=1191523 RepID=I6Z4G0_MELRP|nr:DUF2231 domain-containing protein [Melioribacter roseus]AFN74025.1 hypothetical protein MROS_0783 [Melioribacter roseus P3M-2]
MNKLKVLIILLAPILITAHEGHQNSKPDTVTTVNGDTIAINGKPVSALAEKPNANGSEAEEKTFELDIRKSLFSHLHNKLVHFPIAFSLAALLLMFFYLKDERYRPALLALVSLAFLTAVGAYFTGEQQKAAFENTSRWWVADLHELFGIITSVTILFWLISLLSVRYKKITIILSLVVAALVFVTGFLGGTLAH